MSERDSLNITLASHLSTRLTRLAEIRNIPVERLLDKSVEILLDYMEDQDVPLTDYVKLNNVEAINKNREIILQSRQLLNRK